MILFLLSIIYRERDCTLAVLHLFQLLWFLSPQDEKADILEVSKANKCHLLTKGSAIRKKICPLWCTAVLNFLFGKSKDHLYQNIHTEESSSMCIVYLNTAVYILMQEVVFFNFCMGNKCQHIWHFSTFKKTTVTCYYYSCVDFPLLAIQAMKEEYSRNPSPKLLKDIQEAEKHIPQLQGQLPKAIGTTQVVTITCPKTWDI